MYRFHFDAIDNLDCTHIFFIVRTKWGFHSDVTGQSSSVGSRHKRVFSTLPLTCSNKALRSLAIVSCPGQLNN